MIPPPQAAKYSTVIKIILNKNPPNIKQIDLNGHSVVNFYTLEKLKLEGCPIFYRKK